ncbi:MAG: Glu-tRNA(Gln) amidotransferase subunit GatD, partial [Nanoarchaeota archaeon]
MKSYSGMKVGDRIKVVFSKEDYEGILLESPIDELGVLLLKLDSGYNIGFNRKDIIQIKLLKKVEVTGDESGEKIKKESGKPNIAMIITGGTISSSLDSRTGAVKWLTSPSKLLKFYPELLEKVNISRIEVPFMKASENMSYKDWKKIARTAASLLDDSNIQGLIITHGTDFLHYTAAALSFFLKNLNKPVVLTYSQRSSDRGSSDARLNLLCAAIAASSNIAEIMLVGHATANDDYCCAFPGTKVRKLHTSRRDAFKSVNARPFAKIFPDGKIEFISEYNARKQGMKKIIVDDKFEEKVALLKFYPGQDPAILDYYLKQGYKGIVIEVSGLGHLPIQESGNSWLKKLKEVQKKMVVCATCQTIFGRLNSKVYSAGRELEKTGIIFLEDMLSETAFVKLGWVLGKTQKYDEVKKLMLTNF